MSGVNWLWLLCRDIGIFVCVLFFLILTKVVDIVVYSKRVGGVVCVLVYICVDLYMFKIYNARPI